jgi:hypothetical protein
MASIIWHFVLISSTFWLLNSKTLHVFGVYDVCAVLMTFIILYKTVLPYEVRFHYHIWNYKSESGSTV